MTPSPKVEASPQVQACIDAVIARHKSTTPAALARYYEEVHQHLAPLARDLERENAKLRALVEDLAVDAERYRWVKDKAWYVDAAKFAHGIERRSGYSDEYRGADEDDIEAAIDAARTTQNAKDGS